MNQTDKFIASTILQQMGGMLAMRMIGTKSLNALEGGGLSIHFDNVTNNRCNVVRIVLKPNDTYTVTFWRVWGSKTTIIKELEDVYCDMLMDVFEEGTDMLLTMHKRG